MSYVPDEAIDRFGKLSGNAFKLYCYYCRRADAEGICFPGLARTAREMGWHRGHTSKYRKELIEEGWIFRDAVGRICLTFGFPRPGSTLKSGTKNVPPDTENVPLSNEKAVQKRYLGGTKNVPRGGTKTVPSRYQNRTNSITSTINQPSSNQSHQPEKKKPTDSSLEREVNEPYLDELQREETFQVVDVRQCFEKARIWYSDKGRTLTRKAMRKWLHGELRWLSNERPQSNFENGGHNVKQTSQQSPAAKTKLKRELEEVRAILESRRGYGRDDSDDPNLSRASGDGS